MTIATRGSKRCAYSCQLILNNAQGTGSTLLGTENYQKTPTSAYDVLCCSKKPTPQLQAHTPPRLVTFVQSDNVNNIKKVPGKDGR